jgi:hypothetical protein
MAKRAISLGVDWFRPDGKGGFYKRRFASTTVADNMLLQQLAAQGLTFDEGLAKLAYPSDEVLLVLRSFIEWGHGPELMSKYVG